MEYNELVLTNQNASTSTFFSQTSLRAFPFLFGTFLPFDLLLLFLRLPRRALLEWFHLTHEIGCRLLRNTIPLIHCVPLFTCSYLALIFVSVSRLSKITVTKEIIHLPGECKSKTLVILGLQPHDQAAMLIDKTIQFFFAEESISHRRETRLSLVYNRMTRRPCWLTKQYNFFSQKSRFPIGGKHVCSFQQIWPPWHQLKTSNSSSKITF